jgi:hypothetical protein
LDIDFAIGLINGYLKTVQNMLKRVALTFDDSDFYEDNNPAEFDENNGNRDQNNLKNIQLQRSRSIYKFNCLKLRDISPKDDSEIFENYSNEEKTWAILHSFIQKNRAQLLHSVTVAEIS